MYRYRRFIISVFIALTIIPPIFTPEKAHAQSKSGPGDIDIVAVGDTALNRTRTPVFPNGLDVFGKMVSWNEITNGVKDLFKGDINFANIESVVTDDNSIPYVDKAFNFKMHPNGLEKLMKLGLNLFSIANNHAYDYGDKGIAETLANMKKLRKKYKFHYAGIGMNDEEATKPTVFKYKGKRIAFAAIGSGSHSGPNQPGNAHISQARIVLQRLKDTKADFKILSSHFGVERQSYPSKHQVELYRMAIEKYGVNLVIGHHPHVVEGIEYYKGGLILYSLGNFLIRGCRDMSSIPAFKNIRDFGLLVKIRIRWDEGKKKFGFVHIKAYPIWDMHSIAHPLKEKNEINKRIDSLNKLSELTYINKDIGGSGKTGGVGLTFKKTKYGGIHIFK